MKLNKYFNSSIALSKFLIYLHNKGIDKLHVSSEYLSYNLVKQSLKIIKKKNLNLL